MNENFSDITAEALTALYSVAVKNKAIDTENLTLNVPKFKESLELLKDELDKIYIANIEAQKYSVFNENFYLINKEVEDWKIKLEGMEAENFKKRLELKILQKKDEYGEWYDIYGTNDNGTNNNFASPITVFMNSNLTVKSDPVGGEIIATGADASVFYVDYGSTLNIQSGSFTGKDGVVIFQNSTLNMTGGTIEATEYGITGNGSSGYGNTTVNISAGSVTSDGVAIYQPQSGQVNISGDAEVTGTTAIYQKSGTLSISGSPTISANGTAAEYAYMGSGCSATGDAIVIDNCGYPGGAPSANIKGATINSTNGSKVGYYVNNNSDEGTVLADSNYTLSTNTEKGWVADSTEGYGYKIGEVTYVAQIGETKYASLQAAINAAEDGDTITILRDFTVTSADAADPDENGEGDIFFIGKSLTIDGNDNTITINDSEHLGNWGFNIYPASSIVVTINDLTIKATGVQSVITPDSDTPNGREDYEVTVNLNSVDITGDGECVYANATKTTVNATNCTFVRKGIYKASEARDHVYYSAVIVGYGGSVNLTGCNITSTAYGIATFPSGGSIATVSATDTNVTIVEKAGGGYDVAAPAAIWSRIGNGDAETGDANISIASGTYTILQLKQDKIQDLAVIL